MKHPLTQLFVFALILGTASVAHATSAVAIYPQEGNTTCNNIALNTLVEDITVSKPMVSDDPVFMGDATANAFYTLTADDPTRPTVGINLGFQQANQPINFALVKSSAGAKLFVYPKGVISDTDMRVNINGVDQPITAIALCYGITDTVPPPPEPKTVRACGLKTVLDTTGIECPTDGKRQLVCNFELDKSFFGLNDGTDDCCVCNSAALVECDPLQPAGGPNSCLSDPESSTKVGAEVPVNIQLNNDPYYMSCVAGVCKYIKY